MVIRLWPSPGTGTKDTDPLLEAGLHTQGGDYKPCNDESFPNGDEDEDDEDEDEDQDVKDARAQRLRETGGWLGYLKDFTIFLPYIIPKDDLKVQICLLISILTIVFERFTHVAIPYLLGMIADKVKSGDAPIKELVIFFALDIVAGESGQILVRDLAKIPVQNYSYQKLTENAFNHVMAQSMDFHSTQDSAETMKAIEQGESLALVLETIATEIIPVFVDVLIAAAMFYRKFNALVAVTLLAASAVYLGLQAISARLTTDDRRRVTRTERAQIRRMHQAVQGWSTVTYFNQFQKEARNLSNAVSEHMSAKARFEARQVIVRGFVELLLPITFFGLAVLVLKEIAAGQASPGDFVFFLTYWDSICYPIQYLSNHFRWLATDFVDAERVLMLLRTEPSIKDAPNAKILPATQGAVEFKDVSFAYDEDRPALKNVSFTAYPGQTVALVGQTGAGKSSVLKLLMRMYDITSGSITIAGHDIHSVTQSSLREVLSVVPQTPVFFNASIMENVRYARPNATDEEVFAACHAASMHDTILQYRDGYDTQVGERGVKLSGGEAQRLAIARALLKDAPIVLLDEATSAVDTVTEGKIKEAFETLREGRIVLVIAHRLSTIVDSDQILVFHDGEVVERGDHVELCNAKGRYFSLWQQS